MSVPMASPNTSIHSLQVLLGLGLIAWVATFLWIHGPDVILPYLGLQTVTSGVFAFFMWKAEQTNQDTDSNPDPVIPDPGEEQEPTAP